GWLHGVACRVAKKARSAGAPPPVRLARSLRARPPGRGGAPRAEGRAPERVRGSDEQEPRAPRELPLTVLPYGLVGPGLRAAARRGGPGGRAGRAAGCAGGWSAAANGSMSASPAAG